MENININAYVHVKSFIVYFFRSIFVLLICLLFIGPLRQLSPLIVVDGTPFYVAYLPVSLLIAVARIFGIGYIPALFFSVYLSFSLELHLNLIQTLALTSSVIIPLGISLVLLKKSQGHRYRADGVNNRDTLLGLCFLGLLYPVMMQISLYFAGMVTHIQDDFQYYFSVKEIVLLLRNLQSLALPAVVFTPIFYHVIRILSSATYMRKFVNTHIVKIFRNDGFIRPSLWLLLLSGLFILYACIQDSAVMTSYLIPVLFLVFIYGFINLDYIMVSLLWGITIFVIIRYDSEFIYLIQKERLLICFSSLFMVFTIANTWLSAMHNKMASLIDKLYTSSRRDRITQLPNLQALSDQLKTEAGALCLCYIRLLSVDKIEKHLGFTFKAHVKRVLYSHLRRLIGDNALIYSCPGSDLLLLLPHADVPQKLSWLHTQIKNISVVSQNIDFEFSCGYSWIPTATITNLEGTICGLEYLATQGGEGNISALCDNTELVEQYITIDISILERIKQAIKNNGIQLYVQKIAGVNNNKKYWEVLCRLEHDGEILTPDVFLPVINEFNMAAYFDFKVIETLLEKYDSNQKRKYSFNIMPDTLGNKNTADNILEIFRVYQATIGNFVLEVTEEQLFFNEENALRNIRKLRQAGFEIAIDDFGKGYANFERLKMLEADIIKIDGLFIKNIINNKTDAEIVKSITRIAKLKGMKVVAEYVETYEHANLLSQMDVDYLQGYYIGKPQPLKLQ